MRLLNNLKLLINNYVLTIAGNPTAAHVYNLPDADGYLAAYSDIDAQIPLTGQIPWTQFVYQNSWSKWTSSTGYGTPSYRKHPGGLVELKGLLNRTSGTAAFLETITMLPPSCCPTEGLFIATISNFQNAGSGDSPGSFVIQPSGAFCYRGGDQSFMAVPTVLYGVDKPTGVFFGDSNTYAAFTGSVVTFNQRWSYLVSQNMGIIEDGQGLCGTLLQNTSQSTQPYPTYSTITIQTLNPPLTPGTTVTDGFDTYGLRIVSEYPDYVFIMYGLNDMRWNGSSLSNFQTQLDTIVADLIKKRMNPNRIYLGNVPYINPSGYAAAAPNNGGSNALHLQYNTAVQTVARKYRCKYADVYNQMLNNGGNSLVSASDYIHANVAGHVQIQTAFQNATIPI